MTSKLMSEVSRGDVIYVRTGNTPYYNREFQVTEAITDIVMDPTNWQVAYAVGSSKVFATVNGGTSWIDITGGLKAAGFNVGLTSVEVIKAGGTDVLLVGGTLGVFRATDPIDTSGTPAPRTNLAWAEFGSGLPNALVSDIDYTPARTYGTRATGDVLSVSTMGRGVFEIANASTVAANVAVAAARC